MRSIARMADRLLGAVVPEVSAGACCSLDGTKYTNECYCRDGYVWDQTCTIGCTCKASCGACKKTSIEC
jgi:hypothetical protein